MHHQLRFTSVFSRFVPARVMICMFYSTQKRRLPQCNTVRNIRFITGNYFLLSPWNHVSALQDASWIVGISFGDCHQCNMAADEASFAHARKKMMVPICRRHRWVTVCNGVSKSNINFSENTPTVCQTAEKLNI